MLSQTIERNTATLIAGCKASVIPSDGSVKIIGERAFSTDRRRQQRDQNGDDCIHYRDITHAKSEYNQCSLFDRVFVI